MKTSTKWILGIIIGLLVIAAIVIVGYLAINHWQTAGGMMGGRAFQPWENRRGFQPWNGGRDIPGQNMPMHPNFRMSGQRIGGFMNYSIIGLIIRCAFPILILLALMILILNLRRSPQPIPAQTPYQAAMPAPTVPTRSCSNCGRPIQEDWSHCPYCGTVLTSS